MSTLIASSPLTVAHDYFTQRGGAERVAAALIQSLKPSRVITAIEEPSKSFPFKTLRPVETSFLQHFSMFRRDPRRAILALPLAWHLLKPVSSGTVICSSSGWSHAIRVTPSAKKIVYCHNPARWLYQPEDFFKDQSAIIRLIMQGLRPLLIKWDIAAAKTADQYIANSQAVANRIREIYGVEPVVLHPPVSIDPTGPQASVSDIKPGYFLTVGRGRGYKNISNLQTAFELVPTERLVVVSRPPKDASTSSNVKYVSDLNDAQLRWLYANATALLSVSHEDFGLTPLEANSFGTPALVLKAGGFLDSLDENVSGRYIENTDPETIARAISDFPRAWNANSIRSHAQQFSLKSFIDQMLAIVESLNISVSSNPTRA